MVDLRGIEPLLTVSFLLNSYMYTCNHCNKKFQNKPFNKLYCSRSCSTTTGNLLRPPRSVESKLKTSKTISKLISEGKYIGTHGPKIYVALHTKLFGLYNCHHCDIQFWRLIPKQKCCSISCRDSIRSQNKCRKTQILYFNKADNKNIILQSTWELKIAEWLDTNNIIWERPSKRFKWYDPLLCKSRTYLPDFYLPDFNYYLDVKNPIKIKEDKIKLSILCSQFSLFVGNIPETIKFVERLTGLDPACVH